MILYLIRHAYAGEHGDPRYPDDSLRPITKKGRKRFERVVKAMVSSGFAPAMVGTSPYLRCTQTAEVLIDRLPQPVRAELVVAFVPGCQTADVISWVSPFSAQEIAYVGHAPDIEIIACELLGAPSNALRFAKGAIAAVEFSGSVAAGQGVLRWLITPKLFD
jgi:phosphohistidine phosphatase